MKTVREKRKTVAALVRYAPGSEHPKKQLVDRSVDVEMQQQTGVATGQGVDAAPLAAAT